MKIPSFSRYSILALRTALLSSIAIAVFSFLMIFLLLNLNWQWSLAMSAGTALFSGITVYASMHYLQYRRLRTLTKITKNISRKHFQDYEHLQTKNRDELDYLIKQAIRASKTVEQEIQRLNRIENYRKEFIGDISHELKTPIFAIQGFVETLLNGAIDDEEVNRNFLEKAMRNVNRLIYLTKDLMDISKLETGELKSEFQKVDISGIIEEVVESLQYKAKQENINLVKDEIPASMAVKADRNQIKQVLTNLVENATKYNKPGGSVFVGINNDYNDDSRILVYVRDTGIGINSQYIERITERFFRVDKSRSREKGGTGLGLAIVKHIIEAHGEEFFIESTPNVGSTFSFTLTRANKPSKSEIE